MDSYQSAAMNSANSSQQYHPGMAHQMQQNMPPHTLPPLQNPSMSMYGGSAPQTPRTPGTPNASPYAQMGHQGPRGYPMQQMRDIQSNPYQHHPHSGYNSPMMQQSTAAMSHPQPIAPAPSQGRLPPPLRPMPAGGMQMPGSPYGQSPMMPQGQMVQEGEPLTHVVGSQGRRGILPSAPGRPQVTTTANGVTKAAMIPAKDADGKFPCPHCTKTYLHAKHLKRHLLRHTGDRPYMCPLCKDTFSRSDILKRHFQKCSIRRGNPTGATHLSHAPNHLKKNQAANKATPPTPNDAGMVGNMNGVNGMPHAGMAHPYGEQVADSNQMKNLSDGHDHHRQNLNGPLTGGSSRSSFDQAYSNEIPSSVSAAINPQLAAFSMPHGLPEGHGAFSQNFGFGSESNGNLHHHQSGAEDMAAAANGRGAMPMFGSDIANHQSNVDWIQAFHPTNRDGVPNSFSQHMGPQDIIVKAEPLALPSSDGLFAGMYPTPGTADAPHQSIADWAAGTAHNELYETVARRLLAVCFPEGARFLPPHSIRGFLSADNIQHFLREFAGFEGHLSILHTPTFTLIESYEGLILSMLCVGAVYSDRITASQVRDLMETTRSVVERTSHVLSIPSHDQPADVPSKEGDGGSQAEIEQLQALFLLQLLFTWHGTPIQRENARRSFPPIIQALRRLGLTRPLSSPACYSILHQPSTNAMIDSLSATKFDWNAWVEQEKRARLVFLVYIHDTAMALYFNIPPMFESLEIQLPLPADDAAWDAPSASVCADALGLNGIATARDKNPDGSRRAKQPEFHLSLRTLLTGGYQIDRGATNVYSKFLLIHALIAQVWKFHRKALPGQSVSSPFPSAPGTPVTQADWASAMSENPSAANSATNSAANSGRTTPVEPVAQSPDTRKAMVMINNALDKWKSAWDEDISAQYPQSATSPRRFGFIRDGVHFYFLAKYLLKNTRPVDLQAPPDNRMLQVVHLLKAVRSWVVSDSSKRGESLGSVSEIDKAFAAQNLTLHMAQLFKQMS